MSKYDDFNAFEDDVINTIKKSSTTIKKDAKTIRESISEFLLGIFDQFDDCICDYAPTTDVGSLNETMFRFFLSKHYKERFIVAKGNKKVVNSLKKEALADYEHSVYIQSQY